MNIKPEQIFPISITVEQSKPANLDFLQDSIGGLNIVLQEGFPFDGRRLSVSVWCIVSCAPARALIKYVKLYSGLHGCDKCSQRRHYVGRMTYPHMAQLELQTDLTFRNNDDEEHHKGISPFLQLWLSSSCLFKSYEKNIASVD